MSLETLNIVAAKPLLTDDNTKRTRNGRWTLAQLRQTDGIVPLQSGTNKFDSQKVCIQHIKLNIKITVKLKFIFKLIQNSFDN